MAISPLGGAPACKALKTGYHDAGLIGAGQIQDLTHDIPNCQDLLDRIMTDAKAIIGRRLAGMATAQAAQHA